MVFVTKTVSFNHWNNSQIYLAIFWLKFFYRCTIKSECIYHGNNLHSHQNAIRNYHHNDNQNQFNGRPYSQFDSTSSMFSTPRWLSLETAQCIDFQAIKPEFMPRNLLAPVSICRQYFWWINYWQFNLGWAYY